MSRHEGVSCDNCLRSNFEGKRFKCLICYDYDLCARCHKTDVTTSRHLAGHPMQCILTRNEFDSYYGGESISPENPPSFVCPFCAKLGFTEALLQEHVSKEHADVHTEVVCPICAALPSGDPNLVTDDLVTHLAMEHRVPRDVDDAVGGRHVRRMFYPGRGLRTRTHRNMHFSGGPVSSSAISSNSVALSNNNTGSSAASAVRDSMDPIAELLSQLSGVRRSAQQLQQTVTTASQLHELQSQLQMERQRAAEIRQQLERFPNSSKLSSTNSAAQSINVHPSGGVIVSSKAAAAGKKATAQNSDNHEESRYLLSCLDDIDLPEKEKEKQNCEDAERSRFVEELLFSMMGSYMDESAASDVSRIPEGTTAERAVPIICPLLASTPTTHEQTRDPENVAASSSSASPDSVRAKQPCELANNRDDTGVGNSVTTDDTNSPTGASVSSTDRCASDTDIADDVATVSSRSAPVLASAAAGDRNVMPEWRYRDNVEKRSDDDDDDEDSDKPPSPTPLDQRHAIVLPGRVLMGGPRPIVVADSAGISDYGRDEMTSSGLSKNIH